MRVDHTLHITRSNKTRAQHCEPKPITVCISWFQEFIASSGSEFFFFFVYFCPRDGFRFLRYFHPGVFENSGITHNTRFTYGVPVFVVSRVCVFPAAGYRPTQIDPRFSPARAHKALKTEPTGRHAYRLITDATSSCIFGICKPFFFYIPVRTCPRVEVLNQRKRARHRNRPNLLLFSDHATGSSSCEQ